MKKKLWYIIGGILLQSLLLAGCFFFVKHKHTARYEDSVKEWRERIRQAERYVVMTRCEISPGEAFTEENTELVRILAEQEEGLLATEVEGYCATVELPAGRIVYRTDCCERSPLEQEMECIFYDIGNVEYFEDYEAVDVRIRYGNGENYCVLSGKRLLKQIEEKDGCSFYLTEEEQLLMSGAKYDTEMYRGTTLYLVGTKPGKTEEANHRFLPPLQTLLQMEKTEGAEMMMYKEEQRLRSALEKRLAEYEQQRIGGLR